MKNKNKPKKVRNWSAIVAWFRKSGPMKNKKKDKKHQRQWKQRQNKEDQ